MRYKAIFAGLSFLFLGLVLATSSFAGAAPWHYLMSLTGQDESVEVKRPLFAIADAETKRYYVVDGVGGQLVSFDHGGKFLASFDAGGKLKFPVSMARDSRDNIWVVERSVNELFQVNLKAKSVRGFSLQRADGTEIFASRLAVDRQDRIYVLDQRSGAVLMLDDNLNIDKTFAGGQDFKGFRDFKLESDGLWALDGLAQKVYHFSSTGKLLKKIALEPALMFPVSLAIDKSGQVYVLDRHEGNISVYDQGGQFKYSFLKKGKRKGQLWSAAHILFDWDGRWCVVDEGNGRVEVMRR